MKYLLKTRYKLHEDGPWWNSDNNIEADTREEAVDQGKEFCKDDEMSFAEVLDEDGIEVWNSSWGHIK